MMVVNFLRQALEVGDLYVYSILCSAHKDASLCYLHRLLRP